ncbi:MAG: AAA family ATPase, partial [Acholeplasma sp.]|nr:AAA family ATPase [Acholeplasma sp.]
MKIAKITFDNYKSIKEKVSLDFTPKLITLIGKNGSGKTNVMDSIWGTFANRSGKIRNNINHRIFIEFDENDLSNFSDFYDIETENTLIEAYFVGENESPYLNINRLSSPLLVEVFEKNEESFIETGRKLISQLDNYKQLVLSFGAENKDNGGYLIGLEKPEESTIGSASNFWFFNQLINEIDSALTSVEEICHHKKKDDELIIESHYLLTRLDNKKNVNFVLKYVEPPMLEFERKYIKIDETSIKKEIMLINRKSLKIRTLISELYSKLIRNLDSLNELIDDRNILKYKIEERDETLLEKIIALCNPKIYYLRNESSQLFFKNQKANNFGQFSIEERGILETFLKFNYQESDQEELANNLQKNLLTEEEKTKISADLEMFINLNLPPYEKAMINQVKVSNDFSFSIIEQTG